MKFDLELSFLINMTANYCVLHLTAILGKQTVEKRSLFGGAMGMTICYMICHVLCLERMAGQKTGKGACFMIGFTILATILIFLWTFQITCIWHWIKILRQFFLASMLFGGGDLLVYHLLCRWEALPDRLKKREDIDSASKVLLLWLSMVISNVVVKSMVSIWKQEKSPKMYLVKIKRNHHTLSGHGLYDSGNLLRSNVTGEGITVIGKESAKKLLSDLEQDYIEGMQPGREQEELLRKAFAHRFYVIRYESMNVKESYMIGMLVDWIVVEDGGKQLVKKSGMVGIGERNLFGGGCQILLPEDIFVN